MLKRWWFNILPKKKSDDDPVSMKIAESLICASTKSSKEKYAEGKKVNIHFQLWERVRYMSEVSL